MRTYQKNETRQSLKDLAKKREGLFQFSRKRASLTNFNFRNSRQRYQTKAGPAEVNTAEPSSCAAKEGARKHAL